MKRMGQAFQSQAGGPVPRRRYEPKGDNTAGFGAVKADAHRDLFRPA